MARATFKAPEYTGEGGFTLIPNGTYDIEITDIEDSISKSSQKPQYEVSGKIVGGPEGDRKIKTWYSKAPRAAWKIQALVEASGIELEYDETDDKDEKGRDINEYSWDTDDLIGCVVRFDISEKEYNGKKGNDFTNERAIPGNEKEKGTLKDREPTPAPEPEPKAKEEPPAKEEQTTRRRRRSA